MTFRIALKSIQEKCGIAAVIAPPGRDAAPVAAAMGAELVHRGQDGGGMAGKPMGQPFRVHKAIGTFDAIFHSAEVLQQLGISGEIAVSHTRYRTMGLADDVSYAQPVIVTEAGRTLVGGHNGNIANYADLQKELPSGGDYLDSYGNVDRAGKRMPPLDSEILFRRIARADGATWAERIANGLKGAEGAYSLIIATEEDEVFALRDPWGIRPLSWGKAKGYYLVASESCVLDSQRAVDQHEIRPGEMWRFRPGAEPERIELASGRERKYCDFEDWYFSFGPSVRNGVEVGAIRKQCGVELAREEVESGRLVNADIVIGVPETGRTGAITFARALGLDYDDGIYKGRSTKQTRRTFIEMSDLLRQQGGEHKYKLSRTLRDKVVYVVDDSSVRLTTWRILFRNMREFFGVREIHARSLAPKFIRPCVLGVNINEREELGAVEKRDGAWRVRSDESIARRVGADSVAFLSMAGRAAVRSHFEEAPEAFCGYCHGDDGPPFDFNRYDPEKRLEQYSPADAPARRP
ncbi:MAG: hypothetical protein FJ319_05390 [SAR202 cluster bacterium]|nr:hypothetical protein [SAR202 cluster bacterium]